MFKRKLTALEHINPDTVNINDEANFRELIIWLEDQKIRHYKIEDRNFLKQTDSPDWRKSFLTYLGDLNCPINPNNLPSVVDWLLGLAVQLEYSDNVSKYKTAASENVKNSQNSCPKVVNTNPLDALDFKHPDFRDGVNQLASMLNVKQHPDHLITLKALSVLISNRLSQDAFQNPDKFPSQSGKNTFSAEQESLETGDMNLNSAGSILRLLYIHDLRELQTKINECIVACQVITANPKTDTRLGKVGR